MAYNMKDVVPHLAILSEWSGQHAMTKDHRVELRGDHIILEFKRIVSLDGNDEKYQQHIGITFKEATISVQCDTYGLTSKQYIGDRRLHINLYDAPTTCKDTLRAVQTFLLKCLRADQTFLAQSPSLSTGEIGKCF